jgi:hypothetical protein
MTSRVRPHQPDRNTGTGPQPLRKLRLASIAALLTLAPVTAAGCSDDDASPVCEARDDLSDSVDELRDLSLREDGVSSVESAIADVSDRLGDVRTAASEEIGPQIDAAESAIDGLRTSVAAATSPVETIDAVQTGLGDIEAALQQLGEQLSDRCG